MDFKKFFSSYTAVRQENWFYRVTCAALLALNLLLGVAVFFRQEVVVLVPPNLKQEIKVSLKKADKQYQESWALFFALLLGNLTPRNVDFVVEELEKYLAPPVYQDVMKDIYEQAQAIKDANVSASFSPREVVYDDKTGHVLVKGQVIMQGTFGKPQNLGKTFEFGIAVKNYFPQITYLDGYDKKPKEDKPERSKDKEEKPDAPPKE